MLFLMLAIALAPLMFGSVTTEAQGVLGILLGLALWFMSLEWRQSTPLLPRWLAGVFTAGVLLSVLPLPAPLVNFLSPVRADLAARFPLNAEAHDWITLSLSPALSLRWLWQFVLLMVMFSLVRQAVRRPGAVRWLMSALGAGIAGQVIAEIYFAGETERMVLGLWPVRWGNSAGTFANRNHFAGWLMVAALMLCATSIRFLNPLRSSRGEDHLVPARQPWLAWMLIGLAGTAVVFALMSGSRSGLLALLTGGLMLVLGLKQHSSSRRRGFVLMAVALLLMLAVLPFAGKTLDRLTKTQDETSASYAKWRLWEDAVTIFAKFPLMGSGPGTFVRSNILFKSAGGESTAWHAENDILQWLSEGGLWGFVVLAGFAFFFWRKVVGWFWSHRWKTQEPELALGAFAGLFAIMIHSLFDFPWQVFANASLGAVALGIILGLRDASEPEAEFKLATRNHSRALACMGLLLVVVGVFPILSFREYRLAQQRGLIKEQALIHVERALKLWPLNTERANLWLRLRVEQLRGKPIAKALPEAEAIRLGFSRYMGMDPLNWELRLERAWLDLAFSKDRQIAVREAVIAAGLNPKQAMIPLQFAATLANRDPEKAWEFLLAADVSQPRLLKERLEIAWQIRQNATELWSVVPASDDGYKALAEFALSKKLPALAVRAYDKMRLPPSGVERAERFMMAGRIDLALQALPEKPVTSQERIALAKVYRQAGDAPRSLSLLEPLIQEAGASAIWQERVPLTSSPEVLLRIWKSGDRHVSLALQVAEVVMNETPDRRDMGLLVQASAAYPQEKRLLWLIYRSRTDRHEYNEAADAAISLAEKLLK